jgi:uncharacterized pyridoxal phosphate-containing UPF0001 family protein
MLLKSLGPPQLAMVETIDSSKIADKFQNAMSTIQNSSDVKLNILIEVNTSGEGNKSGVDADFEVVSVLIRHIIDHCPLLNFRGFMTVADADLDKARVCFKKLSALRDKSEEVFNFKNLELSMGMSNDMDIAIEEGLFYF